MATIIPCGATVTCALAHRAARAASVIVGGETLSICGCGLSGKQPYCDGTHALRVLARRLREDG